MQISASCRLDDLTQELNYVHWYILLPLASNELDTSKEVLERWDVSHYYDQHFDDLSEEALVTDLLPFLESLLDDLPKPSFLSGLTTLRRFEVLREESLDELGDEFRLEKLIKLLFVVGTHQSQRHESELKHVVFGFIRGRRCLDLLQGRLHDVFLSQRGCLLRDVYST